MYVVWGCSSDSCHRCYWFYVFFFFFKQKTAYEMRISDWSSDVCSSDLGLLSFVLPASAAAQGAPIIVTGTGLPDTPATPAYAMQIIDRDRLTATASGRIEDALASVAGFQQFRRTDSRASNPSAQGITLRALGGNATSRALMLLDGVPVADPFFGYIPLSEIGRAHV